MTTRTVTATGGGGAANGILLRLLVLNNAALAGTPAVASQSGVAAHQASITTTHTSSMVYGAVMNGYSGAMMPLDAGCTAVDNADDTVNGVNYCTFTAGPTGTPGAATVGTVASFQGGMAAAEVLASGGSISTDASSPAVVSSTAATFITTGAFNAPPGTLLLALVSADGSAGSIATMSVTDSSGLVWTPLVEAHASGQGYAGIWAASVPLSSVNILSSWSGDWVVPVGYVQNAPATWPAQVPVANTGANGNWMIAVCTWRQPPGFSTTVSVADDVRNWWEPLGSPNGTSSASGLTRVSVWVSPSPFPAGNVYVAPTGFTLAIAVTVIEVSGMSPWLALASLVTGFGNAVTAPTPGSLALAAPSGQALVLTACASDLNTATITLAAGGWTALTTFPVSNGTDHTSDLTQTISYQVTTGATTATWTSSASLDMAVISLALVCQPAAPAAPLNQNWPYVKVEAGFGAGARTPWDQITWTDITPRWRGMQGQHGQQYELDTIQAGVVNHILSNNDGALTPGYQSSPYFPNVTVYTPFRIRAVWPPPPSTAARNYVVHRSFMERWPQSLTSSRYQNTNAVATDVWATLTTLLDTILRSEVLQDLPYVYWPCSDVAGSTQAVNYAPTAGGPLQVVTSKYGAGSGTATFGASPGPNLVGDPSGTVWTQTGLTSTQTNAGHCFYYQDPNLPNIANGVTLDGWFQCLTGGPNDDYILFILKTVTGPICQLYVSNPNGATPGQIMIAVWDKTTKVRTNTVVNSNNWLVASGGPPFHIGLILNATTWQVVINGGQSSGNNGTCNLTTNTWAWLDVAGIQDRLGFSGGMFNGLVGHVAIYPRLLPPQRLLAHFYAGALGFGGSDSSSMRMERILGAASSAVPRYIGSCLDNTQGALDIQGQTSGQNLVNIAQSDSGLLAVDSGGVLRYLSRRAGYNLSTAWTFGENTNGTALNSNTDFAGGTITPWTVTSGTLAASTAIPGLYPWSALITPPGGQVAVTMYDSVVPVTAGQSYVMAAWVYSPTGWSAVNIGFDWQTAGGAVVASATQSQSVPARQWTLLLTTQTVPYGQSVAQAAPRVGMTAIPSAGNLLYVQHAIMTAWEASYLPDVAIDFDPSQVYNDITVTQVSAPQTFGGADVAVTAAVKDLGSMTSYGDLTLQETAYLFTTNNITDLANWILYTSRYPLLRVSQITLNPAANPMLWPVALGIDVGVVSTFNRRLWELLQVTLPGQIMTVAHDVAPGKWETKITLVTYLGQVLTCDDPVRGQLNGTTNRLGW